MKQVLHKGRTVFYHWGLAIPLLFLFAFQSLSAYDLKEQTQKTEILEKDDFVDVINMTKLVFEHIGDAHSFHFLTYKGHHYTLALPVILYSPQKGWDFFMSSAFGHNNEKIYHGYKLFEETKTILPVNENGERDDSIQVYDYSLKRNAMQLFLSGILLFIIVRMAARSYLKGGYKRGPKGLSAFIEPVVLFIIKEVVVSNIGERKAPKYTPFLLTLFFFVLINNLIGIFPGAANISGNIAFTFTLAIFSFIVILLSSKKYYWKHIFWPEGPLFIKIILIPIEIISIFTKPFALMIRLFANMLAGHIIIICFISLIFIFALMNKVVGIAFIPFSLAFTIFMYCIELMVVFIQAYVFANLTAVFIAQAMEKGKH